jgi:hypothetical protein
MMRVIENFVRDQFGSWLCVKPALISVAGACIRVSPGTRFSRGTSLMDVDLAALLDDAYEDRYGPMPAAAQPVQ